MRLRADSEDWSVDAQADLSIRSALMQYWRKSCAQALVTIMSPHGLAYWEQNVKTYMKKNMWCKHWRKNDVTLRNDETQIHRQKYRANTAFPATILYKSIARRYRPVSYPDGPITARYRFIKNADWVAALIFITLRLCVFHCAGVLMKLRATMQPLCRPSICL